MVSSLSTILTASATQARKPAAPVRLGPMRLCMRPATRRSTQVETPPNTAVKFTAMNATNNRKST
jgi:hypothetical protein